MCVCVCINAGMPDCLASDQSNTGMNRTNDAGTGPGIFLVRYRTKILDAGMPMLALVSSMPMPSYAVHSEKILADFLAIKEIGVGRREPSVTIVGIFRQY